MIIEPNGISCPCGNKGCWEQYASERVLFKSVTEKINTETGSVDELLALLHEGNQLVEEAVEDYS